MNKVPHQVQFAMEKLNQNHHQVYLVGGCVRDLLCKRQPKDYDLCTSATPEEIIKLFNHTVTVGMKHGTVIVFIDHMPIEITTMHKDGIYKNEDGSKMVEFTTDLFQDLSRRDFTINAMAIDINGKLYDFFNGKFDLKYKIIRATGRATSRFLEDPLRMMRAVRLSCYLDFEIDIMTKVIIKNSRRLITTVSPERIRDELNKILLSPSPSVGIRRLYYYGLLQIILPELSDCVGFDQNNAHHHKNVFDHILDVVEISPCRLEVRLGALFHDIAKPQTYNNGHFYGHHIEGAIITKEIMKRLKYDNKTLDKVVILVRYHMNRYDFLRTTNIKKFINRIGQDNLNDLFDLQIADIKSSKPPYDFQNIEELRMKVYEVLNTAEPLGLKDLAIGGKDLIEIGIQPGPNMGRILKILLEQVLKTPELNQKNILLDLAKEC